MAQLLQRPKATSIGLHAAGMLAHSRGEVLTVKFMAGALGVSEAHLAKVVRNLERAGLVKGARGVTGGFRLARPAARISLREVCEAIEGKYEPPGCPFRVPACTGLDEVGLEFAGATRKLLAFLDRISLADWRPSKGVRCRCGAPRPKPRRKAVRKPRSR